MWGDTLAKIVEVDILFCGWFMHNFKSKKAITWVLNKNWNIDSSPVMLKRWNPLFDAQRERLEIFPLWVKLPGLLSHLWTLDVFCAIKNKLGKFIKANMSFKTSKVKKVAQILVNLDPREGLFPDISLTFMGYNYLHQIDYEGFLSSAGIVTAWTIL